MELKRYQGMSEMEVARTLLDNQKCKNLMAEFSYTANRGEWTVAVKKYWANRDDCSLGRNHGFWLGIDSICRSGDGAIASEKGTFWSHGLTTPLVHVAKDRKTAKGQWYCIGQSTIPAEESAEYFIFGRVCCDFICNNGEWKIWHMFLGSDINVPVGKKHRQNKKSMQSNLMDESRILYGKPVTEPDLPLADVYTSRFGWQAWPAKPEAYVSFDGTFTYGAEPFLNEQKEPDLSNVEACGYEGKTENDIVAKLEDIREIERLMSVHSLYSIFRWNSRELEECWAAETEDVSWTTRAGAFVGREAVYRAYGADCDTITAMNDAKMRELFPEIQTADPKAYGFGNLHLQPLTSPLIVIAEDGNTAKGMWYSIGLNTFIAENGPVGNWEWGTYAVDFIRENGQFKIWHMSFLTDIDCAAAKAWTTEKDPVVSVQTLSEPNGMGAVELKMPTPYKTFTGASSD